MSLNKAIGGSLDKPMRVLTLSESITVPKAYIDSLEKEITVKGNILPDVDATRHLGSSTLMFGNVYAKGNVYMRYLMSDLASVRSRVHFVPFSDNYYDLGSSGLRWRTLYVVSTVVGDLGFSETTCPICQRKFRLGDRLALLVLAQGKGVRCVPVHFKCHT